MALVAGGVVGNQKEFDQVEMPSMSLLCGNLPRGADIDFISISDIRNEDYWKQITKPNPIMVDQQQKEPRRRPSFLLFTDPWTNVDDILQRLKDNVVAGGISVPALDSTTLYPTLAIGNYILPPQGSAVAVRLDGTIGLQAVVAQGSRPIGPVFTITEIQDNLILGLDGEPPLLQMSKLLSTASEEDKELIQQMGYLCGISSASTSSSTPSQNEDFLVRQIIGITPDRKGIVIGTTDLQKGGRFSFFVRDGRSAQEDMKLMMQRTKTERIFAANTCGIPMGAIQISCVARGSRLFGQPDFDVQQLQSLFTKGNDETESKRSKPIAGFFANGEIGPVGLAGFSDDYDQDANDDNSGNNGRNFLHGFTTVAATICDLSSTLSSSSSLSLDGSSNVIASSASQTSIVFEDDNSSDTEAWG